MRNYFLITLFTLTACATNPKPEIKSYRKNFSFKDLSGEFSLEVESGAKGKELYYKKRLLGLGDQKEYEKSIAISTLGQIKTRSGVVSVLRPKISQFTVWLDKQEYFSQIKVDPEKRKLFVTMRSPEEAWKGTKEFDLPAQKGAFCFFNQIIDCLRVTGFFHQSIRKGEGRIRFTIIWDGYPYMKSQYRGIPETPFSSAIMAFDGKGEDGLYKYTLGFNGQVMFFHLNENKTLEKRFWVAEGLSQMRN